MSSPRDVPMGDGDDSETHKPFTIEENIRQLNDIDKSIVQLMNHTSTALDALSVDKSSTSDGEKPDPSTKKEALHEATDSFLSTLQTIDACMKRQIFALEEAGIVNLTVTSQQQGTQQRVNREPPKASLKPNGMGSVGTLDIGWLNSQGARVEKDMEAELWAKVRGVFEKDGENLKL